ncbi:MAG TPA: chemotaxis protein CheB [Steroidobacteraceae bacterium]
MRERTRRREYSAHAPNGLHPRLPFARSRLFLATSTVAIGACGGGLEAVSELLAALPRHSTMVYVLVQHLDPAHDSRSSQSIQAENLFFLRQLALYIERAVEPRRIDAATRIGLTFLSHLFDRRDALTVVSLATLIRWHRAAWRLYLEDEVSALPAAHSP